MFVELLYHVVVLTLDLFCADKNRGFAFVEYEIEEDAFDALENMDGAELFGKVLHCNIAKTMPKLTAGKAVWNAEEWIKENMKEGGGMEGMEDEVEYTTLVPN